MPEDIIPIRGGGIINSSLPFSPGIRAGDYVFVSGMASADENGAIIHDEFENEARRTYENLGRVLRGAGLDFDRVVQVRCYLQRQEDWDAHNRIYREYFSDPRPARTTITNCLPVALQYEIECVAVAKA